MSDHVHVRLGGGVGVNEHGELVEQFHCRCGETWTRTYRVEDGEPEM
ncbi:MULTISPECIES: hypothetical protein [Kitasatospora]|uniref:Aldehyde-activating protein n=1 Tax=Kitasatospora cystarginea TaxID=58350 RepID=A0ABP5RKN3_9ACTN